MQVDLQKILSVSSYPGLYKYVSQARQGIIVESLANKKRICLPSTAKVSSLGDITIFTETDDMLLKDVLQKMKEKHGGQASISHKSDPQELVKYFEELLPEYDKEKVFPSHMKKMVEWYNILQQNDLLDFIEAKTEDGQEKTKTEE